MTDKTEEIRLRHLRLEDMRSSTLDETSDSWTYFGHWAAHHDRATLLAEIDQLTQEIERLRHEDTLTRHALKGWVYVCPDGGDEPTHRRVQAVVAEVDRLREIFETLILVKT